MVCTKDDGRLWVKGLHQLLKLVEHLCVIQKLEGLAILAQEFIIKARVKVQRQGAHVIRRHLAQNLGSVRDVLLRVSSAPQPKDYHARKDIAVLFGLVARLDD